MGGGETGLFADFCRSQLVMHYWIGESRTFSLSLTSNLAVDVMVMSDLCDGEGVERLSEGEDRRIICAVGQTRQACRDGVNPTNSP